MTFTCQRWHNNLVIGQAIYATRFLRVTEPFIKVIGLSKLELNLLCETQSACKAC